MRLYFKLHPIIDDALRHEGLAVLSHNIQRYAYILECVFISMHNDC